MEYYSRIKMIKLLIHTITWMGHHGIMLSEKSQSQTVTHSVIPFTKYS